MLVSHGETRPRARSEVPAARRAPATEMGEEMEAEPRYEVEVVMLTNGTRPD